MANSEALFREMLDSIAQTHQYHPHHITIHPINSGGANYTSNLYLATISSPSLPDLKLFAKVACVGEKFRNKSRVDTMFQKEQIFFKNLIKEYQKLEEKYEVPKQHRFFVPKYYGGISDRGCETVILEDLTAAGYEDYNRSASIDWEHASKSIEELAKFHALSFVFEKEKPLQFKEMVEEMKSVTIGDQNDPAYLEWVKRMVDNALTVVEEPHRGMVKKFFFSKNLGSMFRDYRTPTRSPVLVHGDFRTSNLLFKEQDGVVQPMVVDFQAVHAGRPAADLAYFVALGTDEDFRRRHFYELVDLYYTQLELALTRFNIHVEDVYPRTSFDDDLRETLPYILCLGVVALSMVLVEAKSVPKVNEEADFKTFVIAPNKVYVKRLNGIVNDMVRWGAI